MKTNDPYSQDESSQLPDFVDQANYYDLFFIQTYDHPDTFDWSKFDQWNTTTLAEMPEASFDWEVVGQLNHPQEVWEASKEHHFNNVAALAYDSELSNSPATALESALNANTWEDPNGALGITTEHHHDFMFT